MLDGFLYRLVVVAQCSLDKLPGDPMKKLVVTSIALLVLLQPVLLRSAGEDTPKDVTELLTDYAKEYNKAKEPADRVLSQEARKTVARLSAEAELLEAQVADKLAGRPVPQPHAQLAALFTQYDGAVAKLTKPLQDKYTLRADTLLKAYTGKDLQAVTALGEAKRIISGSVPMPASLTSDAGGRVPRQLRLFKSLEQFQAWVQTTEWSTEDGKNVTSFPEPGKMKIVKPNETLNYKIEVPEIGVIRWKWSDGKVAKMRIEENLKEGRDSSNKPLKRTKPER